MGFFLKQFKKGNRYCCEAWIAAFPSSVVMTQADNLMGAISVQISAEASARDAPVVVGEKVGTSSR